MKHSSFARLAGLGTVLLVSTARAEFVGITTSLVAQPTIDGIEWDVWRVYAQVTSPADQVTFCSGNASNPVIIETDGPNGFYQNEEFGVNNTEPNPILFDFAPDLAHDSYVTIGAVTLDGRSTQTQGLDTPGWECSRLILRNGAWFRLPDQPLTVAGKSLQVVIAQFTIDRGATLSGQLRIAGVFDGDSSEYYITTLPNRLCLADVDGNGLADVDDFVELILDWGPCPDPCDCPSDITRDGVIDVDDIIRLMIEWGVCE